MKIKLPMGRWKCAEPEPAFEMNTGKRIILALKAPVYDFYEPTGLPTGMAEVTDVYGSIISFPVASLEVIQVCATKMVKGKKLIWIRHPKAANWINEQWVFSPSVLKMGKEINNFEEVLKENKCYIYNRI